MSKLDERIDVHAGSWVIPTLVFITLGGAFCISLIDAPLITLHARIEAWATIVIALIVQAIPFLVLGILVSSVLSAFVPASVYQRFPRGGVRCAGGGACGHGHSRLRMRIGAGRAVFDAQGSSTPATGCWCFSWHRPRSTPWSWLPRPLRLTATP